MISYFFTLDLSLFLQSTPSLVISLIGLLVTGRILEKVVDDLELKIYPILLQSNCILNFKGNIELLYALYLSSMRLNDYLNYKKYLRYAFDNGYLVLLQSITIGITIGIIGISKLVLSGIFDIKIFLNIFTTSLVTCTVSTLLFILFLYFTIEFSKYCDITPDNVVLPTISSISDYLSIRLLILFTKFFKKSSIFSMIFIISLCLCFVPICLFFIFVSKKRMPIQSVQILFFTYILSTLGGYFLDIFSSKYSFIASTFPVYSGLAVSIAFIYLHKIFTSINNNIEHDSEKTKATLLVTSFIMILFYILLSMYYEVRKGIMFYILLISFFLCQVGILLKLIEELAVFLQEYEGDIGIVSIPIITALGDVLSTLLLILVASLSTKKIDK
ncbi:mgtE domain-containing protein [Vairimorpha necatrix]|uniref:MgtE domain-containing protein n=1 Tax=Vairimorpha necatrix TaxID=6039 RepID=A0AAX4J924_9MICR